MSYGRRKIYSDATEITAANVVEEVNAAYLVHTENRNEISELYRYYRNKTAIENKTKKNPYCSRASDIERRLY